MLLIDLLLRHARTTPDSVALVQGSECVTYSELLTYVHDLSKALIGRGIASGDRIATLAPPCMDYWICFLATATIGAEWLGLNPRHQRREYKFYIEDASPKIIFTFSPYEGRDYETELKLVLAEIESTREPEVLVFGGTHFDIQHTIGKLQQSAEPVSDVALESRMRGVGERDTAAIVYTSGTTGKPKGAMLSHYALLHCAKASAQWLGKALEKVINPYPINHVGSLNAICMNVFMFGGTIYFLKTFDIKEIIELYESAGITHAGHNQTTFQLLLDSPGFSLETMSACKVLVHGGSKTDMATLDKFRGLDAEIASVYAQTESCGYVLKSCFDSPLEVMSNTIGKPVPGVEARIFIEEANCLAKNGEIGELQLKFDWMFSGYINNVDATRAALTTDGYLRTGDLCRRRADGNFELVDRIKNAFKSGGYDIYPAEIEQVLTEHPKVSMAAVIAVNDTKFVNRGYAFVLPQCGEDLHEDELFSYLRKEIADYKIPKFIDIVQSFPILPNTKIDRQSLKDLVKQQSN